MGTTPGTAQGVGSESTPETSSLASGTAEDEASSEDTFLLSKIEGMLGGPSWEDLQREMRPGTSPSSETTGLAEEESNNAGEDNAEDDEPDDELNGEAEDNGDDGGFV